MPGLKIGDAYISLGYKERDSEGRMNYEVYIDLPRWGEHPITELKSGRQGGTLQEGFESLLDFLAHAGERFRSRDNEDEDELFPRKVMIWASENVDELSMLRIQIEETKGLITE